MQAPIPTYTPEDKTRRMIDDGWEPTQAKSMGGYMSDREFASTYDQGYRKANPLDAANRSYDRFNQSLSRKFAPYYEDHIQPLAKRLMGGVGNAMNSGYVPAAGVGALGGAGIAALLNLIRNRTTGQEGGYDTALGLGALGGAGLGALSHYTRDSLNKQAFDMGQERDPYTAVMLDPFLSPNEKQEILRAMGRLSNSEVQDLKRMVATVSGAGVGAMIMRYVAGKGLISSSLGAILGGVIGNGMVASHNVNALNQYY